MLLEESDRKIFLDHTVLTGIRVAKECQRQKKYSEENNILQSLRNLINKHYYQDDHCYQEALIEAVLAEQYYLNDQNFEARQIFEIILPVLEKRYPEIRIVAEIKLFLGTIYFSAHERKKSKKIILQSLHLFRRYSLEEGNNIIRVKFCLALAYLWLGKRSESSFIIQQISPLIMNGNDEQLKHELTFTYNFNYAVLALLNSQNEIDYFQALDQTDSAQQAIRQAAERNDIDLCVLKFLL